MAFRREKDEKQIRKNFIKFGQQPNILIVTEKLLTGFDAPILYAMYLDKPIRDHTLLQAIARVNRPYENERAELLDMDRVIGDYVIVHELLHFSVPHHGKLWKSLMRAHLGDYEKLDRKLKRLANRAD